MVILNDTVHEALVDVANVCMFREKVNTDRNTFMPFPCATAFATELSSSCRCF